MARNKIEEIEEMQTLPQKPKRGRPPKGTPLKKDRKIDAKKSANEKEKEKSEETILLAKVGDLKARAEQQIEQEFQARLPEFVQKRREEFEKTLEQFNIENDVLIQAKGGKVNHFKLSYLLSKPLTFGLSHPKFNAADVSLCADLYWECVAKINETIVYTPTIYQLARLMGCAVTTLVDYKNSNDPEMRNTMSMVYDMFVDYYTVKGLSNELNTIMAIFALKAQYGLRDNDAPQVTVNNFNNTVQQSSIDELEKQFNINIDSQVIDLEV